MMRSLTPRAAVTLAASSLVLAACGGSDNSSSGSEEELRIGVVLSLTGAAAPFGVPERDVVEILTEQINENGGVNGRQVKLFVADDKTDPTESAKAVRKLAIDDEVQVIIGATVGSATLSAAPIAQSNSVAMVAPNGTIAITDPENDFADWVFRSSINDELLVDAALNRVVGGGETTFGVIHQQDAYGEASLERAKEVSEEEDDLEIVGTAAAPATATDLSAQATKVANANPEAVLVQASSPDFGAAAVRALSQVRYEGRILVAPGLTTGAFLEAAGDAAEGVEAVGAVGWDKPTEGQQELIDLLEAADYGPPKGFGEAIGGGAFNAVIAAVESIDGELSGEAIRDALESACFESLYPGPEVCFGEDDHDGFTIENGAIVRVTDGQWVTVED